MNIVILAAGQGKRMRSNLPKVLQRVAGRPMLEHVLNRARETGDSNRIVIVVGHGAQAVRERFEAEKDICWAVQKEQLGTGDALKSALPELDVLQPTLVLFGDVPFISTSTLKRFIEATPEDAVGLLTIELDNPTGYGRIVRDGERILRIVEEKDATAPEKAIREINTGIMLLPTAKLSDWLSRLGSRNAQGEYYLTDVISLAVDSGFKVCATQAANALEVSGANSKAQLAALERGYQRARATELMDAGVTLIDPDRIDIRGHLTCGTDVTIDVGCVFEGNVELGDDVTVGPYVCIKNAVIGQGTVILPFTHIEGAETGADCRIGPFSRLRPGTRLVGDNHVGDFVEIKKSVIGQGSKVNHLTYIGDTDMGARVNIGAGTITCNYDGVAKHRTVIGDDAFIGSGTELVAPVTVGRGATIGAGTTLTKPAPEDKLTLARARQTTVEGWKRPTKEKKD